MPKDVDRVNELLDTKRKLSSSEEEELFDLIIELDIKEAAAALSAADQLYVEGLIDRPI